ncbi:MAG: ABC transporter substrate-binding protein, partial [Phototrophicales bacterium]
NADLFEAEGLAPPDSWEALAQNAQALTVREGDEVIRWGIQWPSGFPYWLFQPLAIGSGQNIIAGDTEVVFDDPDVIEAVNFYISLSQEFGATPAGVQANWAQSPVDFANGSAAMIVHSTGSLAGILASADFEVGVQALPGQEEGTYASVPGGGNLYIFSGAPQEKQDAAWKFIQFLTDPERAATWSINTGYIAARESSLESTELQDYFNDVPQAAAALEALDFAQAELSTQNLGEVRNIFHDFIQRAYNGEMSAAEAMAQAQAEAEAALEPFMN